VPAGFQSDVRTRRQSLQVLTILFPIIGYVGFPENISADRIVPKRVRQSPAVRRLTGLVYSEGIATGVSKPHQND
jgi:hypothetical protein